MYKKEARGIDNADHVGEILKVNPEYIVTKKGTLIVEKLYSRVGSALITILSG